jgi:TonB family protein
LNRGPGVRMEGDNMAPSKHRGARMVALLLLASGLQLPLFAAFTATTQGGGTPPSCPGPGCKPPEQPRILATLTPPPPPPQPPPERPLVELPDAEDLTEPPPTPAENISDKTTRTERETVRPNDPKPKAPRPKPTEAAEPEAPPKTEPSPAEGAAPEAPGERPPSILDRRRPGGALERATSEGAALRNAMRMSDSKDDGEPSNPQVAEEGARTILNSDRHRFADFFMKVKRDLEVHWDPSGVHRRNDPSGERFGVKDRYTILLVTLDPAGRLQSLVTSRPSGLDFLDEEARRAFRIAAPFLNPPAGLVGKDGVIRFEFGFYFEITAGTARTRWRRM